MDVHHSLVLAGPQETEDHLKSAAAWTLGQIGRHTPDHAKAVADTGAASRWESDSTSSHGGMQYGVSSRGRGRCCGNSGGGNTAQPT
jgi:hypothetical protein